MKSIKTYQCECGEDFYEDDVNCVNCRKPIDKSKLKEEEVADIKYSKTCPAMCGLKFHEGITCETAKKKL